MFDKFLSQPSQIKKSLLRPIFLTGLISLLGVIVTAYVSYNSGLPFANLLTVFLVLLLVLIWLALIVTAGYINTNIIEPLMALKTGVSNIIQGTYGTPIKITANNEFTQLANDFNTMSVSLFEAQQSLIDAVEENTQLYREADKKLANRITELSSLQKVSRELNSTLILDKLLPIVLEETVRATQADFGNIALYHATTGTLKTYARSGWPPEAVQETASTVELIGITGRVVQNNQPEIIADVSQDPDYVPVLVATRSQMIVPIQYTGRVEGLIKLESTQLAAFTPEQLQYVQALADQAAIAIRNAKLVERLNKFTETLEHQVNHRTDELKQERDRVDSLYTLAKELSSSLNMNRVLNRGLALLQQTIPFSRGTILLVDDATGNLVYRASTAPKYPCPEEGLPTPYKLGVGLAGKILEQKKPTTVNNLDKTPEDWLANDAPTEEQSILAAPLTTDYEIVGVLMLYHTQINYFNADHLRLVTAATPIIATAINNAKLYNLISDQVHRLGVLLNKVQTEARKNEAIVEGIADGVLVLDKDHTIQLVNPVAATIMGQNRQNLQNKTLQQIQIAQPQTVEDQLVQELCHIITSSSSQSNTAGSQPTDNTPTRIEIENKVVLVILSNITVLPDTPPGTLVVLRDISKEAELERIKNEFISTVSHELRTPMTSIKGYTDLLVSDKIGSLTDTQRKFVQVIKNNADRLTALVNDILDISRIDTGRVKLDLQYVDLPCLIRETITSFEHQIEEKNLSLQTHIPDNVPLAFADANRVTQVLVNLISNAVKYTPPNQSLGITVTEHKRYLQIDVKDTGLGIPTEDLDRIFDRFFRSERDASSLVDGTGLGLSIVKMFVDMMGGNIWVESTLNQGSTFSFTLPLEDHQPQESSVAAAIANQQTILVVDDNTDILAVLKRHLEIAGYHVLTTTSGKHAVNLAKTYHPDAITLDILLDDVDGFEVLETLKADPETKDIPVIIASFLKDAAQQGLAQGAADYLVKPFDKSQVLDAIHQQVDTMKQNGHQPTIKTVLVADDNKDTVAWLKTELHLSGFEVICAYNGEEALLLTKEQTPDMILLDLKMPGISGIEVIEKLKDNTQTANIPVIVITGHAIDKKNDTIKLLNLGAKQLLTKPLSAKDLVAQIKDLAETGD